MNTTTVTTKDGHRLELVNLLDQGLNKLYNMDFGSALMLLESGRLNDVNGEFALATFAEDKSDRIVFTGARTIGVPARVACQIISPECTRFIVAHTISEIQQTWESVPCDKDFDPLYTEMWRAFHSITIETRESRDRRYAWFLPRPEYAPAPEHELLPASIDAVGTAYVQAIQGVIMDQLSLIPNDEPIGVALSGGADSACVAVMLLAALRQFERRNPVYLFTLVIDAGGSDYSQAQQVADVLFKHFGHHQLSFQAINVASSAVDAEKLKQRSAQVLEEYHIRDVECGMAGLLLYDGVQQQINKGIVPPIRFDFNGDGGNEIFRDYPLTDEGYGTIPFQDVLAEPFLYLLGYHPRKQPFNPNFSAGLSRAYVRTFNPARLHGVKTFSPMIDRRVIEIGRRIPTQKLAPNPQTLHTLRGKTVSAGIKSVLGINLPIFPKARFQEGCAADPRFLRVTREDQKRLKATVLHSEG